MIYTSRQFARDFLELQFYQTYAIARELDLIDESEDLPHFEWCRAVIKRAREQGKIEQLKEAIRKAAKKDGTS